MVHACTSMSVACGGTGVDSDMDSIWMTSTIVSVRTTHAVFAMAMTAHAPAVPTALRATTKEPPSTMALAFSQVMLAMMAMP